jgi:hypothetical protein
VGPGIPVTAVSDIERQRLRLLVAREMEAAADLHADDYQLITPSGHAMTKAEYLGRIASGKLRYQVFEPSSDIAVLSSARLAVLRYTARITVAEGGEDAVAITCWHTDCYELRDGRWQAVWSQATAIREGGPA